MSLDRKAPRLIAAGTEPAEQRVRLWSLGRLDAERLLALSRLDASRYPVLLESAASHPQHGQFDILMAFPGERLECFAGRPVTGPAALDLSADVSFLDALDSWWRHESGRSIDDPQDSTLPFVGGWFLYLSYELALQIEPILKTFMFPEPDQLLAQAVRVAAAVVRERATGLSWFVAEESHSDRLSLLRSDLQRSDMSTAIYGNVDLPDLDEDAPERYLQAVQAGKQHIAAGDVYQANLSRGWRAQVPAGTTAVDLYRQLRHANPAPFAGLAHIGPQHAIISSSPERLLQTRGDRVSTRPIAGTRPRAKDPTEDAQLVEELKAHPKERAEHIMLLDLERNDLGRICVGGSVTVDEYMTIETYTHVHHIVSSVQGKLRASVTPGQAIGAVFPGGTITGCPKVRCMQVIAEQEQTSRGAYTGSMGYLNRDGSMDLNILIRTLEMQGQELRFRAGAGIVADSIPVRELDETRAKAKGMLRALSVITTD